MKGWLLLGVVLAMNAVAGAPATAPAKAPAKAPELKKPLYTTYFYTAGEAVVHGYAEDTKVRIVSLDKRGTIWEGTVGIGEARTVQTGAGVFGFLSDKKAAILVGTPSSCAVVGYFAKDENGAFKSNRFFMQLPSAMSAGSERLIVFAYEPASVEISVRKTEKVLAKATLAAGEHLTLEGDLLRGVLGQVVQVTSKGAPVSVEAYFDEGFMVPADNGRGSGKRFLAFVGTITTGENDINVIAQGLDAKVLIREVGPKDGKPAVLFEGVVPKGGIKSLTLKNKYVEITSDVPVNVVLAAFAHYQAGYAEHHFQTGLEGSGIENDFLVTTSGELWLFSYFAGNEIAVTDARSGAKVFNGVLGPGGVRGLQPGFGLFRVKGSKGLSVMGGSSACGADYSPAGGMFAVDEALFEVIAQVREERIRAATASGKAIDAAALAAPMTEQEWTRHAPAVQTSGYRGLSRDEANERAASMQHQK